MKGHVSLAAPVQRRHQDGHFLGWSLKPFWRKKGKKERKKRREKEGKEEKKEEKKEKDSISVDFQCIHSFFTYLSPAIVYHSLLIFPRHSHPTPLYVKLSDLWLNMWLPYHVNWPCRRVKRLIDWIQFATNISYCLRRQDLVPILCLSPSTSASCIYNEVYRCHSVLFLLWWGIYVSRRKTDGCKQSLFLPDISLNRTQQIR